MPSSDYQSSTSSSDSSCSQSSSGGGDSCILSSGGHSSLYESSGEDESSSSNDIVLRRPVIYTSQAFFKQGRVKLKAAQITEPEKLPFLRQPALASLKKKNLFNETATFELLPFNVLYQIFVRLQDDPKTLSAIAATSRKLFIAVSVSKPIDDKQLYYPFLQKIYEAIINDKFDKFIYDHNVHPFDLYDALFPASLDISKKEKLKYMSRLTEDDLLEAIKYEQAKANNKKIAEHVSNKMWRRFDWVLMYLMGGTIMSVLALGIYGSTEAEKKDNDLFIFSVVSTILSPCMVFACFKVCHSTSFDKRWDLFRKYEDKHLSRLNASLTNPFPELRRKVQDGPDEEVAIDIPEYSGEGGDEIEDMRSRCHDI